MVPFYGFYVTFLWFLWLFLLYTFYGFYVGLDCNMDLAFKSLNMVAISAFGCQRF